MQTNKVFSVPAFEEISELITKKRDNVAGVFLTQEELDSSERTELKLVPYTTVYAVDADNGKLMFIQAKRPQEEATDETENPNTMTTIGFNTEIVEESNVFCLETVQKEDGMVSYTMSLQNLIDTSVKTAAASFTKATSVSLTDMEIDPTKAETAFFIGGQEEEKTRKDLGFSLQIQVTPEKFEEIKQACVVDTAQYTTVDTLGINLDVIVEEMDISNTVNTIAKDLKAKHSLEDWSCRIFEYVTRKTIANILRFVTYKDLLEVAKFRAQQAQEAQSPAPEEQDQQEITQAPV